MPLKKPSQLFKSEVVEEELSSPVKKYLNETYQQFQGTLSNIENLQEKIDQIYTEYPKTFELLAEEVSNRVTKSDLDNVMYSQLEVVDRNFKEIQEKVKGVNRKDLREFKNNVSQLTEIVNNLIETELPQYKNRVTKTEVRLSDKFQGTENKVTDELNKFSDKFQSTENKVTDELNKFSTFLQERIGEFNIGLEQTKEDVLNTNETFNKLKTIVKDEHLENKQKLEQFSETLNQFNSEANNFRDSLSDSLENDISDFKKQLKSLVSADFIVLEKHVKDDNEKLEKRINTYIEDNQKELVKLKDDVIDDVTDIFKGDIAENVKKLEDKIKNIQEQYDNIKPEEILQEGLLNIQSNEKNSDPLTPLDQNFVTTKQLQDHYRVFLNRIQEQLSTLGGGGETRLEFLDDIDRNSALVNGKVLQYNEATKKWKGVSASGIGTEDSLATSGIITAGNVTIGGITTALVVNGDGAITGVLTVGQNSVTLDGTSDVVQVGTALTLGHTQGIQFHTQSLHASGFEVNQINASGISTFSNGINIPTDQKIGLGDTISSTIEFNSFGVMNRLNKHGASDFTWKLEDEGGPLHMEVRSGTTNSYVQLNQNNNKKLETKDYGVEITGTTDTDQLNVSGIATVNQLNVSGDGYESSIITESSYFSIKDSTNTSALFTPTGSAQLNYNNQTKIQTTNTGASITGKIEATDAEFSGNVSIGGTLTYEDVTNIDSVGIITARKDVHVGAGLSVTGISTFNGNVNINGYIDSNLNPDLADKYDLGNIAPWKNLYLYRTLYAGDINVTGNPISSGIITATLFSGSGANITGVSTFTSVNVTGLTSTATLNVSGISTFSGGIAGITTFENASSGPWYPYNTHFKGKVGITSSLVVLADDLPDNQYGVQIAAPYYHATQKGGFYFTGDGYNSYFMISDYAFNIANNVGIDTIASFEIFDRRVTFDSTVIVGQGLDVTGVSTFSNNIDLNADLDVDGHTELDNVNVSGIITSAAATVNGESILNGNVSFYGANYGAIWRKTQNRFQLNDNAELTFGTNNDTSIKHNNSHLLISNTTGNIDVTGNVLLNNDLNVTGITTLGSGASGQAFLEYQGNLKLSSEPWGTRTTGTVQALGGNLQQYQSSANSTGNILLTNQTGNALKIGHESSNSFITGIVGNISINAPQVSISTHFTVAGVSTLGSGSSGSVTLQHQGATKLNTASWGASVWGVLQANNLEASNGSVWIKHDNQPLKIGAGEDFQIIHNGSESLINNHTSNLSINAPQVSISTNFSVSGIATFNQISVAGISSFDGTVRIKSDVNAYSAPAAAGAYHLHLQNPQNDAGETVGIAFGLSTGGDIGAAITHEREGSNSCGNLRFYTKENSNPATMLERMRISKEGNIGIGSTSPDYSLDVEGSIGFSGQTRGLSQSASSPTYSFDGDSDTGMYRGGGVNILSFATAGLERFSLDAAGNFTFKKAHDNVINADGNITIDYKMSNSTKIRNFTKSDGFYFYPMSDTYPFVIGSGFGSDEIKIYRTGEINVGTGITLSGSTGNIIATGIVTATAFVGSGANLTALPAGNLIGALPAIDGSNLTGITAGFFEKTDVGINTISKVGIGTTSPQAQLEVNVGSATTAFNILGTEGQLFSVTNNLSSGSIFSVNDISGSPSIDVDADGTIQLAPLLATEKVGIGTTNPQAKLDVNGSLNVTGITTITSSTDTALYVDGTTVLGNTQLLPSLGVGTKAVVADLSGNGNWVDFTIFGGRSGRSIINFGDHDDQDAGAIKYYHNDNSLNFFTNGSTTERLTITGIGSVGIGTNDPDSILHLYGGDDSDCVLSLESDGDNSGGENHTPYIRFATDGGLYNSAVGVNQHNVANQEDALVFSNSANANGGIIFRTDSSNGWANADERLRIASDGKVGINSTVPQALLDVNGSFNVSGISTLQDLRVKGDNILLDHGGSTSGVTTIGSYYYDKLYVNSVFASSLLSDYSDTVSVGDPTFPFQNVFLRDDVTGFNRITAGIGSTHVNLTVTVAAKTSDHRYHGQGSSLCYDVGNGYVNSAVQSPFMTFTPGRKYRFDQSHYSNSTHQIRFYYEADRTNEYTTGVTVVGTAGNAGAYTQIEITDSTPKVLHYQCINHPYMGNAFQTNSNAINTKGSAFLKDVDVEGNLDVQNLDVEGHTELDNLNVTGFSTFSGKSTFSGNLTVTGIGTFASQVNYFGPQVSGTNDHGISLLYNGVASLLTFHDSSAEGFLRSYGDLYFLSNANQSTGYIGGGYGLRLVGTGFTDTPAGSLIPYTLNQGLPHLGRAAARYGTVFSEQGNFSGIVTATTFKGPSGVTATFIGDGSGLTGVTASGSGIVVKDSGSSVGTAQTIDFGSNLSVSAVSAGIVTVTGAASGGGITVQDEGSALSTDATTINFVGSGVEATGNGSTKTITVSSGGVSNALAIALAVAL